MLQPLKPFFALFLITLSPQLQASNVTLDRLEGSYKSNHLILVPTDADSSLEDQGETDFKIQKSGGSEIAANIKIYSLQSHNQLCLLQGIAKVEGDQLVFRENISSTTGTDKNCVLKVMETGDVITFSDEGEACRAKYCNALADFAHIHLSKNSRLLEGKSATTLTPIDSVPLCFGRDYGDEELNKYSRQLLRSLHLSLQIKDKVKTISIYAKELIERSEDIATYTNQGICPSLDAHSGSCVLEDNTGNITVQNNNDGSIFVQLTSDTSLFNKRPLKADTMHMTLSSEDRNNNLFTLYPEACSQNPLP